MRSARARTARSKPSSAERRSSSASTASTKAANGITIPIQRIDPSIERDQIARTRAFREARDAQRAAAALDGVRAAAEGSANVMPALIEAVDAGATLGEVCGVLREVFGTHVARERIA